MITWLKQLLCWHDWEYGGNEWNQAYKPTWRKCRKCGKLQGRLVSWPTNKWR